MLRFRALAVALVVTVAAAACSGDDDAAAPATTAPAGATLPSTPVGTQLDWFVDASATGTIAPADYEAHFSPDFRSAVTVEQLNAPLASGPFRVVELRPGLTPHYLTAVAEQAGQQYLMVAQVDPNAPGTPFRQLSFGPLAAVAPDAPGGVPTSWAAIEPRVAALAPRHAMVVSEIGPSGRCGSVFRLAPDDAQPLASVMKLYVLGALAEAVRGGQAAWGQEVPVQSELATLPSGVIQDEPDGTPVFVRDLAALMISISDNTATDHLIDLVGRPAVEGQLADFAITDPFTNLPFLTIDESFVLQVVDYPALAGQWRQADSTARRAILSNPPLTDTQLTPDSAAGWSDPRWDGIGWFASPADVCSALAGLRQQSTDALLADVGTVLSISDGGLGLPAAQWPTTWFKGGSEPGVLTLAYLAENADGRTFVTVLLLADPDAPIDEVTVIPEALTLVRGAFALAAG